MKERKERNREEKEGEGRGGRLNNYSSICRLNILSLEKKE